MSDLSHISHDAIEQIYRDFVDRINARLFRYHTLQLDCSWPSLAIIDLLTFPLRQRTALIKEEEDFLRDVSIYLATFIAKIWSQCGFNPEIIIEPDNGVSVRATLDSKPCVLSVEHIYKKTIAQYDTTIPIFEDFFRPASFDTNIISGVTLGLITGLSPLFDESPFRLYEEDRQKDIKLKIEKILARDISEWFTRVHPDNPFVQIPELYLKGFILPPFLMEQTPPLMTSVLRIKEYLSQIQFPLSMSKSLADTFASCIDEQISLIGITLLGNFSRIEESSKAALSAAKSRRYATPLLREALYTLRQDVLGMKDWTTHIPETNEEYNTLKNAYHLDMAIGLFPWLSLSYDTIVKSKNADVMMKIVASCKEFYFSDVEKAVLKIVEEDPSDIEVRIQQIKLMIVKGDFEQADFLCKKLISEPGADTYPDFFNLWGSCLLELGEPELAARYFRAAKNSKNTTPQLMSDILNNLAWSNIQLGLLREAKESLLSAEKLSFTPLTIYLNIAYLYGIEKEEDARNRYLSHAVKLAPYDRRVFANLI